MAPGIDVFGAVVVEKDAGSPKTVMSPVALGPPKSGSLSLKSNVLVAGVPACSPFTG